MSGRGGGSTANLGGKLDSNCRGGVFHEFVLGVAAKNVGLADTTVAHEDNWEREREKKKKEREREKRKRKREE